MELTNRIQVVNGKTVYQHNKERMELKGMSLFWSIWGKHMWTKPILSKLAQEWSCNVVRLPIGYDHDSYEGYLGESGFAEELKLAIQTIGHAVELGLYVILDIHNHYACSIDQEKTIQFLERVSSEYPNSENLLYELCNEPLDCSWSEVKEYSIRAIDRIRKNSPDAVCIVGLLDWGKDLNTAYMDPVPRENVLYAFHFYSGSHRESLSGELESYLRKGFPVIISECGVSQYDGNGDPDFNSFDKWLKILSRYGVSWCGWSINDKEETSSSFVIGYKDMEDEFQLTDTGKFFRDRVSNYRGKPEGLAPNPFYPSPFRGRHEELKILEEISSNCISLPTVLLKRAIRSIIENSNSEDFDLFMLFFIKNYRKLNVDTKKEIEEAVDYSISCSDGREVPNTLYMLRDTIKYTKTSGKVPNA